MSKPTNWYIHRCDCGCRTGYLMVLTGTTGVRDTYDYVSVDFTLSGRVRCYGRVMRHTREVNAKAGYMPYVPTDKDVAWYVGCLMKEAADG